MMQDERRFIESYEDGGMARTAELKVRRPGWRGRDRFRRYGAAALGMGVATPLMRHLLELQEYDEFVLRDIKDTKLDFTEYGRRLVRHFGRGSPLTSR
jgi:hypothetical protein